jgi:hypothetical protein
MKHFFFAGVGLSLIFLAGSGFGLFLTPVFYVVIMWFKERRAKTPRPSAEPSPPLLVEESAHT